MYDKQNLPKQLVEEIELFDFLNSFSHLAKPQTHRMKGVGSTKIRMSHSDMSFSEFYEYLKNYAGIADVEVKPAKKSRLGKGKPPRIIIYDKTERNIYAQDAVDSTEIKEVIAENYAVARQKSIKRIIRSIEDGKYRIDKDLSLKEDERFERKRYRYLFLYSNGKKTDLKNCMLAYKLSKDEIDEALKHKVLITEATRRNDVAENDDENQEESKKAKVYQRLVLKRYDICFTLNNLLRVVLKKVDG